MDYFFRITVGQIFVQLLGLKLYKNTPFPSCYYKCTRAVEIKIDNHRQNYNFRKTYTLFIHKTFSKAFGIYTHIYTKYYYYVMFSLQKLRGGGVASLYSK